MGITTEKEKRKARREKNCSGYFCNHLPPGHHGLQAAMLSQTGGFYFKEGEMTHIPADANLIASAPDLLKACKACMEAWKDNKTLTTYEMKLLQSAIVKAEGRDEHKG